MEQDFFCSHSIIDAMYAKLLNIYSHFLYFKYNILWKTLSDLHTIHRISYRYSPYHIFSSFLFSYVYIFLQKEIISCSLAYFLFMSKPISIDGLVTSKTYIGYISIEMNYFSSFVLRYSTDSLVSFTYSNSSCFSLHVIFV